MLILTQIYTEKQKSKCSEIYLITLFIFNYIFILLLNKNVFI